MLEYLIVLLDDTSTSYCHYGNKKSVSKLISLETLKTGVLYGMKENLMIQFVYPDYGLSSEFKEVIESIDHSKIVSSLCEDDVLKAEADVIVYHDWIGLSTEKLTKEKCYVLRTSKADLFEKYLLLTNIKTEVKRLSIVVTDIDTFTDGDFEKYNQVLITLSEHIEKQYLNGNFPQLNIITDRLMLSQMNNCGAGDSCITLAPNGKFYICPAFYYDNEDNCAGDLQHGLDIKNKQLYCLDHAPICCHCDAYQCHRCIWLNRKTTLEVNTPSHEQCVVAHLERNTSRDLQNKLRKNGMLFPEKEEIKEIDYLDPFDKREEW